MPFGCESREALHTGVGECRITLADGRAFADRAQLNILGATVDRKGSNSAAVLAREKAVIGMWFRHHKLHCSSPRPARRRLQRLVSTAGAAFLFGAGGWALWTETCAGAVSWRGYACAT